MKTLKAKREGHEEEPHAGDFYVEAQRSRDRDFHHRRRREEKADRRWDEEE